jgi:hypothetical protein
VTYNVQSLPRPLAHKRPRNDGYPLACRNVAILAVVQEFVWYRHNVCLYMYQV